MAKKTDPNAAEIDLGYSIPDSVDCPFTGQPLKVEKLSNGSWWAKGEFYTTRLFDTRQALMHWLCWRGGKAPKFPPRVKIVMMDLGEKRQVELAKASDVAEAAQLDSAVREFVDKVTERGKR